VPEVRADPPRRPESCSRPELAAGWARPERQVGLPLGSSSCAAVQATSSPWSGGSHVAPAVPKGGSAVDRHQGRLCFRQIVHRPLPPRFICMPPCNWPCLVPCFQMITCFSLVEATELCGGMCMSSCPYRRAAHDEQAARARGRSVGRAHFCLDRNACRSRRACQTHVLCGRNARAVRPNAYCMQCHSYIN
jgi:hypothetical protein